MTKRRVIFMSGLCSLMVFLAAQTLSPASGSDGTASVTPDQHPRNMTGAEKKKEAAKKARQLELEQAQKNIELAEKGRGPLIDRKKKQKEAQEKAAEIKKEFLREKAALGVTEEQWKLIKPKLEQMRQLRDKANSKVGLSLASGPSDNETNPKTGARTNVPIWQWDDPWKEKPLGELTEAQKLARQLIALVESKNATPEQFIRAIDALRKARRNEADIESQLAEARREVHEALTARQGAALVLMDSL